MRLKSRYRCYDRKMELCEYKDLKETLWSEDVIDKCRRSLLLKELSDIVNHIGKVGGARGLLSTTANGPTLAHTLCRACIWCENRYIVLEPFQLVLEPIISCLTCIGSGRSRCLPKGRWLMRKLMWYIMLPHLQMAAASEHESYARSCKRS